MRILLTSGGTKVEIDAVRSITNMSHGTFGSKICKEFITRDHEVDFLMAEGSKTPFQYVFNCNSSNPIIKNIYLKIFGEFMDFVDKYQFQYHEYTYNTFDDYAKSVRQLLKLNKYDMVILACAASDFSVDNYVNGKIRSKDAMSIHLKPNPKIIGEIKQIQPETFLVGFKLLVGSTQHELESAARESRTKNNCDVVIANDLSDIRNDNHKLTIISPLNVILKLDNNSCEDSGTSMASELVHYLIERFDSRKQDIKKISV